jgi:glycosyltransferase involved in cell wall biosynthesis
VVSPDRHVTARPRIAGTQAYPQRREWVERVDCVHEPGMSGWDLIRRLTGPVAREYDVVILDASPPISGGAPELVAGVLMARRRRRPSLILADCNWEPRSGLARVVRRLGMRVIDRAVARYCVYTTAELETFPRRWKVDPGKMAFTPYYHRLSDEELAQPATNEGHVFSGGDSRRDYDTLLEAAAGLPQVSFRIASARWQPAAPPPNARVGRLPHDEYIRLMRSAAVVVVPLHAELESIAGLETLLTAMAMGKVVVATGSPGLRDYVDAGRTGLIVPPGDAGALRAAIGWALDPAKAAEVEQMARAGRELARRDFSPDAFIAKLVEVAEGAVAQPAPRPARPFGHPGTGPA